MSIRKTALGSFWAGALVLTKVDRRWQGERSGGDFGQRLRRARRVKMLRSVSVSRRR